MKLQKSQKSVALTVTGAVLLFTLTTGCASSIEARNRNVPGGTQSETSGSQGGVLATTAPTTAPTVKPTDYGNEWNVDTSLVKIPADVTSAYGVGTKSLIADALTIFSTALNGLPQLAALRTGDEKLYYEPMRPYMTDEAYAGLIKSGSAVNDADQNAAGTLVPKTSRDGGLMTVDNVAYTSDPKNLFFWTMQSDPQISLVVGKTAAEQRVAVDVDVENNIPTLQGKTLTYIQTRHIELIPNSDGRWIVTGWSSSDIAELSAS